MIWSQEIWILILVVLFAGYGGSDELFDLLDAEFPHLWKGDNAIFIELFWGISEDVWNIVVHHKLLQRLEVHYFKLTTKYRPRMQFFEERWTFLYSLRWFSHPWDPQDCHVELEWVWHFHKTWVTRAWLLEVNFGVLEAGILRSECQYCGILMRTLSVLRTAALSWCPQMQESVLLIYVFWLYIAGIWNAVDFHILILYPAILLNYSIF